MTSQWITADGNEAVASVAHRLSEVLAIYPITPSTAMGELADAWSAAGRRNLWGAVPTVIEMQSEAGAAGAIHGALSTGALAATFTASQGLLLMIPNMYKIAGELTPAVFHVAARSLAAQALSIFGDHSDVMAARSTGFALLASGSPQEAQDLALIAHAATLEARVPFLHFFDGFRTSHEINKLQPLSDDDLRALVRDNLVAAHRNRALSPDHPVIHGTSQNPDVYFQARETVNPYYQACPEIVQRAMDRFAERMGRRYSLFNYQGAPDAERVIVIMGSGAETAVETARYLSARGEKVGVVQVHLYRPFSVEAFISALPETTTSIAALDRVKEPGSTGEPLYLDVVAALDDAFQAGTARLARRPRVIGGRYGLSSKEFTPAMVKAVFDELSEARPKRRFTVGITDDVSHTSLDVDPSFSIEPDETVRCVFWGLGSDGTVGANKNSIKIIGEETANYAQGYFVYDSKKSGSVTISHLRFGPQPIRAPYLIERGRANFVACHQFNLLERQDVLSYAAPGAVFLLNSPWGPDEVWDHLPEPVIRAIRERRLRFYVIDGSAVARGAGMAGRVNTVMQACFFALSGVLPREEAIAEIKRNIEKAYGKRGEAVVRRNFAAVDQALSHLYEVPIPAQAATLVGAPMRPPVPAEAPAFVRETLGMMIAGRGDDIPVSALPADGAYPVGTAKWEKRDLAFEIPIWDPEICIQCGKCTIVCPHAAIRMKVFEPSALEGAPDTFQAMPAKFKEFPGYQYSLQVAPEDCTSCGLCFEACPVKDKREVGRKAINMEPQPPLLQRERANWSFFTSLPEVDPAKVNAAQIKNSQLLEPLFEFSGACSGCGETPYIKLITQLFGDHMIVANATGCSSIYGGNLPTTPWSANAAGRGPAWSNSLFEDNAEFGLGMRVTLDQQEEHARALVEGLAEPLGGTLVYGLLNADQTKPGGIAEQRRRVAALKERLAALAAGGPADVAARARDLLSLADTLVRRSVWIIGGDGWAYDIGFGGLDHVLASGRDVNILVLDTEVYSNTGGQASKATPRGAVAKFAARGKPTAKKDLGMLAMAYGGVYVAKVAMGANDAQTLRALLEAEAYPGPSLVIAYSHCIAHGIDMRQGLEQQKLAAQTGYWPLYRFNPDAVEQGKNPLTLDSHEPSVPLRQFLYNETRYRMLAQSDPARADELLREAQHDVRARWTQYAELAAEPAPEPAPVAPQAPMTSGNGKTPAAISAEED
ncbi:MAG TPA: pyruvate:ferredoxin (flavodoxin) oxidoreductase [Ktedonobacterales bacterium]|nr:pyruvate:ferredoxin (flavodoxin) oxidoreductase [Ktedonobacterales bacterium]